MISRRSAILTLGTSTATLLRWPAWVAAQDTVLPRFSFIVVSDTHLGQKDGPAAATRWQQTAKAIDAGDGDFVLHLGDVVDGGREAQYPIYKETRKTIRKPVHEIPGNHDPQELFEKHIRKPVELAFDHKGVRFLLFNNSRPDSHDGFVSDKQLAWLAGQCADAVKKRLFVMVCCHVPVHDNKHPDRGWHVKPKDGQAELYALLARHKAHVLALFHGHFHNGIRGWDDHAPLQEVVFPSALYNQNRKLVEQKAPGYYLAQQLSTAHPGFVQVTLQQQGMLLRYRTQSAAETEEKVCPLPQIKA